MNMIWHNNIFINRNKIIICLNRLNIFFNRFSNMRQINMRDVEDAVPKIKLLIVNCLDAGECLAFKEFERCAAAG